MMTRRQAREIAMHLSFESGVNPGAMKEILENMFDREYFSTLMTEDELYSQYPDENQMKYIVILANGVDEHAAELDHYIEKYAKNWRVSRISRVAVAIMRTAMFEVLYMPDVPNAAAISEAVEIAKKYEEKETVSFINGILGSFVKGEVDGQ